MLISKDDFDKCFFIVTGELAINVITGKKKDDLFILYVVGLRKFCGFTFPQMEEVLKNCERKISKALSTYSGYTCSASSKYKPGFLDLVSRLSASRKVFAKPKTGYERLKLWRSKDKKNAYKNRWNAENRAKNATKKSKGREKGEAPRLVQRRNVINDNKTADLLTNE